ncbi:hypothetical protein [Kitasatospora sp. NPDC050543]|uniref:hypothetical protein n=1 Tax=Kitasatospora sp. NPDC050543 TaxID=3364054 RepID=UPI00378B6421
MDVKTMARPAGRVRARRTAAVAGLVLALGTVAACGSSGGPSAGSSPSPVASSVAPSTPGQPSTGASSGTATTAPSTPDPGASGSGPTLVPTMPVTPIPIKPPTDPTPTQPGEPTDKPTGPGIAIGEPAPVAHKAVSYRTDGNKLTVWFYGGICEKFGLKTDESKPGSVEIRIVLTTPIPVGTSCPALAKKQSVSAELDKQLMGRAVVDTGTGQPVPLESDPQVGPGGPDGPAGQ